MSISSTSTIYNPNNPYENENFVDSQEEVNFVKIDTNGVGKIDKTDGGNKNNNGVLERSHTTCTVKSRYSRYQSKPVFDIQKEDDELEREEDYQISISQDGKFVITFDTGINKIIRYK